MPINNNSALLLVKIHLEWYHQIKLFKITRLLKAKTLFWFTEYLITFRTFSQLLEMFIKKVLELNKWWIYSQDYLMKSCKTRNILCRKCLEIKGMLWLDRNNRPHNSKAHKEAAWMLVKCPKISKTQWDKIIWNRLCDNRKFQWMNPLIRLEIWHHPS